MLFKLMATLSSLAIAAGSALVFGPSKSVHKVGAQASVHVAKAKPVTVATLTSLVGGAWASPVVHRTETCVARMVQVTDKGASGKPVMLIVVFRTSNGERNPFEAGPLSL